jgi:hypothetical protein
VRRATLNLGVGYEFDTYESANGSTASGRSDQNYFNIDGSIGMPVFSNTCSASIFLQYSNQSGDAADTWDSVQSGFSISRSF